MSWRTWSVVVPRALTDPWVCFDAALVAVAIASVLDGASFSPSALRLARVAPPPAAPQYE